MYLFQKDTVNITNFKYWNPSYWFYVEDTIVLKNKKYVKIYVPRGDNPDIIESTSNWSHVKYIDATVFNKWLAISKDDFNLYQQNHYPMYTGSYVLFGLVVPFKIHPAIDGHASSLLNADFSVGEFAGYRLNHRADAGFSFGGVLGVATLNQNSSNNTGITNTASETMGAIKLWNRNHS